MGACMSGENGVVGRPTYEDQGALGKSRTGEVKLMKNRKTGELVAVKFIERAFGERIPRGTEREIINHRKLLHPNVIRFREVFMTDTHLAIVLDYATGGRLLDRMAVTGRLKEDAARHIFGQIVEGVAYCHQQGIYHRDLRLQNVLLDGNVERPTIKLSNFGYARNALLDSAPRTIMEDNPAYMPPEMLLAQPGTTYEGAPVDVWHMGVILFFLVVGDFPFQDPENRSTLTRKTMQLIVSADYQIPREIRLSKECKDLIARTLQAKPENRISLPDMERHPWVRGAGRVERPKRSNLPVSHQSPEDISNIVQRARDVLPNPAKPMRQQR